MDVTNTQEVNNQNSLTQNMTVEQLEQYIMQQKQYQENLHTAMRKKPVAFSECTVHEYCVPPKGYRYDRYGRAIPILPKVNESYLKQVVSMIVQASTGQMVTKLTVIPESNTLLRHACADCGVSFLPPHVLRVYEWQMEDTMYGKMDNGYQETMDVPFYFCTACGNLYIYFDRTY